MKGTKDSLLNSFFCIVGQTAGSKAQARTYRNTHECPTGGPTHIIPQFKALSLARQLHYKALSFLLLIEAMDKYYRLQAVKKNSMAIAPTYSCKQISLVQAYVRSS